VKEFESRHAYFSIGDGIVVVQAKDDSVLNFEMAAEITLVRLSLQNQRALPVCFEMNGIRDCDKSGRDFLAKFGWPLAQKVAIHTANGRSALIARYYNEISKPIVETGLFHNREQAIAYLRGKRY